MMLTRLMDVLGRRRAKPESRPRVAGAVQALIGEPVRRFSWQWPRWPDNSDALERCWYSHRQDLSRTPARTDADLGVVAGEAVYDAGTAHLHRQVQA